MQRGGGRAVVRQAWLVAEVGALLIGFAIILAVGCSGDTGSQPSGSQNREVSQSAGASLEKTSFRESESTHEATQPGGTQASEEGQSPDKAPKHGGSIKAIHKATNYPTSLLLKVDGVTYYTSAGELTQNLLDDDNLGPLFAEVNGQTASSTTKDRAASKLVPVYAVEGYDTSFTLRKERVEELDTNRDVLLESMANMIPEALDTLEPEEHSRIYRMLELEIIPGPQGFRVSGALDESFVKQERHLPVGPILQSTPLISYSSGSGLTSSCSIS